jgi:hypothetical protein
MANTMLASSVRLMNKKEGMQELKLKFLRDIVKMEILSVNAPVVTRQI